MILGRGGVDGGGDTWEKVDDEDNDTSEGGSGEAGSRGLRVRVINDDLNNIIYWICI
jgi:hypothetical protein